MAEIKALEDKAARSPDLQQPEIYEGQIVTLTGFVWREAFPGPPNYTSIEDGDQREVYWMLVLPSPITLIVLSFVNETSHKIPDVKRLQLILNKEQYNKNRYLILSEATITGRVWQPISGHHHLDAQIEVMHFEAALQLNRAERALIP